VLAKSFALAFLDDIYAVTQIALLEDDVAGLEMLLTTFRRKKPFSDDRATKLGARTRRQIAAGKV
jgi:hypothetical protein